MSCAPQTAPTWCRLNYVCRISQAHEIKLVEAPGLLVSCLHRVLPPLVNHLISWVPICNYRQTACVSDCCETLGAHHNDEFSTQAALNATSSKMCLLLEASEWKEGLRGRQRQNHSGLNESLSSASHWFHLDVGLDLHTMPSEPGCALKNLSSRINDGLITAQRTSLKHWIW